MAEDKFGNAAPKLTLREKKSFDAFKRKLSASALARLNEDQTQVKQLKQLCHIHDSKDHGPHWDGKHLDPTKEKRSQCIHNPNTEWLKVHFNGEFLKSVMDLGKLKVKNLHIPKKD